jgi:hypothetical protein
MNDLRIFIPITKVDAAKRLVYGVVTAERPDAIGEVCDYESTKPHYQKWSQHFADVTDGKSLGNLRAMHGNVAAGKLTEIVFDDAGKQIEICAKVVDDDEWAKVDEGVYTGFSQGGKYLKRWPDPANPRLTRYTAEPVEVSLVDNPMLPGATFEVVRAGGVTELRKFKMAAVPAVDASRDASIIILTPARRALEKLAALQGLLAGWEQKSRKFIEAVPLQKKAGDILLLLERQEWLQETAEISRALDAVLAAIKDIANEPMPMGTSSVSKQFLN